MIRFHSIFCQLLNLFSRYDFQKAVNQYSGDRHSRGISCAYANAHRPWKIYREVFYQFLTQCRCLPRGHKFRFKNKMLSIDATVIDLCASMLTGYYSYQDCPYPVRRIEALDPKTGEKVVLLTNQLRFGASTISTIYKDRWQI